MKFYCFLSLAAIVALGLVLTVEAIDEEERSLVKRESESMHNAYSNTISPKMVVFVTDTRTKFLNMYLLG